jgi:membrane dipeptidase
MKLNRREFIQMTSASAAGVVVSDGLPTAPQSSAEIDSLYDRSLVVDSLSIENWDEAGFAAWKKSGYTAIQTSLSNRNFAVAMRDLEAWRNRFAEHPDKLIHATKAADIERAKREGKLAVVLGFQNATIIEDNIGNLDRLYAAGTRCIQLTYNSRNLLGDGCTERTNVGLSDFGIRCVEKMNELGIIVDLSHCGEQTSADGITFSRRPPAFTHTMCKAIHFHPRAKPDELLRAMSSRGGMTGIVTLGYFVSPNPDATLEDYLKHLDHAVKVCGIEHVGLATDYQIRGIEAAATRETWYLPRLREFKPSYNVRWPPWIPELDKPERFRTVAHGLAKRGYKTGDIEKLLGGNWVRYFRDIFGG